MINTIIQIILSIFLISIMAFISYSVYNNELISNIVITNSTKKITKIFTGILDYSIEKDLDFETYDKEDYSYLDINPSVNQNGGAEYSYNFWLFFAFDKNESTIINKSDNIYKKVGDNYNNNSNDKITLANKYITLFYKGEKQSVLISNNNGYECSNNQIYDPVILIKNPLVKIRNDGKEIVVEFNNINYPETYNAITNKIIDCNNVDDVNNRSVNKFGIKDIDVNNYKEKYNMITIVFQEQPKNDNLFNANKSNCKVYFNGELKADKLSNTNSMENDIVNNFKSRVMKSNLSKLHINPSDNQTITQLTLADNITKIAPLRMGDLTYYNYALNNTEIKTLYNNGFNKYEATFKKRIKTDYTKGFNSQTYTVNPI